MAWKPTRQLLIEFPDHPPEAADGPVQDDPPGADPERPGAARTAEGRESAVGDRGTLRPGTEGSPRPVDGSTLADTAGQRSDADSQRGAGTGPGGGHGPFAARILNGRAGTDPRPVSNGDRRPSHVARVTASRT